MVAERDHYSKSSYVWDYMEGGAEPTSLLFPGSPFPMQELYIRDLIPHIVRPRFGRKRERRLIPDPKEYWASGNGLPAVN